MAQVSPENFGAVRKGPKPEDFGATRISASEFGAGSGIITPDEAGGMVQPTKEQLNNRELLSKYQAVTRGELKFSDLTPDEQKGFNFYQDKLAPGGTFMQRLGEGIKMTPEGKASFIQAVTNKEKPPIRGQDNKIYVYDDKTGQYQPFNPEGLDIGDFGQTLGENIGVPVNIGAAALGGTNAPAQAIAGAGNAIVKQGASALLPGDDKMSLGDRLQDVGINSAASGAIQGAWNLILKGINFVRPSQIIARQYAKSSTEPVAKEGAELVGRVGGTLGKNVFLDVAQETQDPWLNGLKAIGEQSFEGKKMARDSFNNQIGDALKYSAKVVDDMTSGALKTPEQFGNQVKTTFQKAIDNAFNARESVAKVDYAPFNGNTDKAPVKNLLAKIEELSDLYSPLQSAMAKGARIGKVTVGGDAGNDMLTISQMDSTRKILVNMMGGKGKLFEGLDPSQDKHIARELHDALMQDFQGAGDWVGNPGLKKQLETANTNYYKNSEFIRTLENNVLGKVLRPTGGEYKPGEDVAASLVNLANGPKTNVGKLRAVFDLAEFQNDPSLSNGLKQQLIEGLMTAGNRGAGRFPSGYTQYNPQSVVEAFVRKDPATVNYIFKDPRERQALKDLVEFNRRIGSITPRGGLNPVQEGSEAAAIAGGAATGNLSSLSIFGSKFVAKWYLGKTAAKMVFDPQGQQALRTLARIDPTTKAWTSAATYTMERTMAEPGEEETAEQLPELAQ